LEKLLRDARKKSGKTQADIAAECQVSQPTVHAWERGVAKPSPKRLADVALAYGLSFERLRKMAVANLLSATRRAQ
jgi:transcriptional regulator with XRE-family HTH domain